MSFSLVGNNTGFLTRLIGSTRRGEPRYSESAIRCRVDVLSLTPKIEKTSVRTDSSASRGNAEEEVAAAKILFQVAAKPGRGDRFVVAETVLRIEAVTPRFDTFGKLDHYEVALVFWDADDRGNEL
ncbi:hypothetical protein [Methylorubrum extorquens]|uniref:hypothetical protein n=1 Tax=Methylorubrum extorquens TaxID=408 RepID=UPI0020A05487|nr:hypothetical protein [Methylorubrum extorquens]MCP1540062.1 hypothetical protein [Methylorubrum extorquens]